MSDAKAILESLNVTPLMDDGGDLAVTSPIDGAQLGAVKMHAVGDVQGMADHAKEAFSMAKRATAGAWRACAYVWGGAARGQGGSWKIGNTGEW